MTRQRARYLRRATTKRVCPNCGLRAIVTDRHDVTALNDAAPVFMLGRTTCKRCGHQPTSRGTITIDDATRRFASPRPPVDTSWIRMETIKERSPWHWLFHR